MSASRPEPVRREWYTDAAVGGAVAVLGLLDVDRTSPLSHDVLPQVVVVLGMAAAAGLFRRAPGAALALVWVACGVQVLTAQPVLVAEAAALIVSYGTARYGSTTVLWLSGLSIPAGAFFATTYESSRRSLAYTLQYSISVTADRLPTSLLLAGFTGVAVVVLAVPWLLGLLLRSRAATRESQVVQQIAESDREQALEIARLRARQARLANDVHDVVGHSLAVILAQAESAQFLPDDDQAKVRETLANIATSARASLGDVRQVLADTGAHRTTAASGGLDSLIEGVRAAGNQVESVVVGTPQPLPPELDAVAFRVLQEMLTNALKHGRRGEPVEVERHWDGDDLRIEVHNVAGEASGTGPGLGVDGMRHRLASVGGRLDVRRREEARGATFTATAWVPLRPVPHA